jgi:hypothetical protein
MPRNGVVAPRKLASPAKQAAIDASRRIAAATLLPLLRTAKLSSRYKRPCQNADHSSTEKLRTTVMVDRYSSQSAARSTSRLAAKTAVLSNSAVPVAPPAGGDRTFWVASNARADRRDGLARPLHHCNGHDRPNRPVQRAVRHRPAKA